MEDSQKVYKELIIVSVYDMIAVGTKHVGVGTFVNLFFVKYLGTVNLLSRNLYAICNSSLQL